MEVEFLKTGSNEKFGGYLETMREAALSIYQEYLSDKAMPRLKQILIFLLKYLSHTETLNENCSSIFVV